MLVNGFFMHLSFPSAWRKQHEQRQKFKPAQKHVDGKYNFGKSTVTAKVTRGAYRIKARANVIKGGNNTRCVANNVFALNGNQN